MSSFDEIRADLLKKYNVSAAGSSSSTTGQSGESEFYTIRKNLLEKYSEEKTEERFKTMNDWATRFNNVMQGVSDYDSKRNGAYTLDASGGYSSEIDSLIQEYDNIKDFADRLGMPNSQRYVKQLQELRSSINQINETMSQFDGEEEYNQHQAYLKDLDEKSKFDIAAGEREIVHLERILEEYKSLTRFMTDEKGEARAETIRQQYGDEKGIKSLISQKKRYMEQARRIQEGITLSSVADNADFKDKSGYVSTFEDGVWSKLTSDYSLGYNDLTYEYINNQNGIRDEIKQKHRTYDKNDDESVYEENGYDYLTENEVAIYNYYYAKDGKEKAEEYLDSIQESLNFRKANSMYENMEGKTALELAFGVAAGLDQFESGLENLFNTEDDYIAQSAVQMASGMVRGDLADNGAKLPDWMGGASVGQAGYDLITTSANMVPSIMTSMAVGLVNPVAGEIVGTGLMGASAAGNAYQEMLNLGYDKEQARMYSTLVGGAEASMQYLLGGIGALGGKVSGNVLTKMMNGVDNAFFRTALKLAGNMASEGLEEGIQEILTPWFQNLVMHTDEDVDWGEVAYSTLLGALTAGVMEGGSTVSSEVNTYKTGRQLQKADISAQRLAEIGNTFAADTVAHQLAGRVNENTGAYTMGRLFNEIGATLTEQNVNEITEALVNKGMSRGVARANAEAMASVVEGGNLTDAQVKIIEANEVLAEAVRTTIIDSNATWFQRTKGYNEALMALAKEKASPKPSRTNPAQQGGENAPAPNTVDSKNENGAEGGSEADIPAPRVKSISTIKDGRVTVKLEDGSEVDVREAGIDPDDGVIIETIAQIDGISSQDANFILGTLKVSTGASAQMNALGAKEMYKYGFYGISQDHIAKHGVFANSLSETQRNAIYETGRKARQQQVDNRNATVAKKSATAEKSGKVHFEGDHNSLTERQSASLSAMEKVAEILGVQIHVLESKVDANGKRIGANGWYDPKDSSIHIDLYAGAKGEGVMLFTVAHELTHHIRKWSPAKFKVLADFLMQEYGKKGVNVDALIREQMAKAKRNGRTISYDTAYEEVVADSMETMLSDGNVLEKLAKLKQKDQSLWQKIKDFISDLAAKIRKVYEGMTPDSVEGRYVAEMVDSIEKLQDLFTEALVEASENYQASLNPGEEGVVANQNGDPVAYSTEDGSVLLSMRTYEEDGRKVFRDYLQKCVSSKKLTKEEMQEMLDGIEEIYQVCKEFKDKYAPFSTWSDAAVVRDTYGKPVFSVVTPNGDYKMNLDFSLVCKKRRTLDAVFNEMSRRGIIDDFELGQKSVVKINEIIRKHGLETACALCFVDAKRFRQASMADQFTSLYNELVLSLVPEDQKGSIDHFNFSGYETIKKVDGGIHTWNASELDFSHLDEVMKNYGKGTVEHKAAKYIKSHPEGRKLLLRGDFMSSQGFDAVKTKNKDILKLYNSKKGTGGPKAAFGDVQYMNEIVKKARTWTPEKAYAVGGVRIQSFSDYVPRMVFDYVQMIYDLAATKLPAHAYTKEALFVKQFGLTGVKINMSLIPAIAEGGIAPGLDANGNYVWAGESFDYEIAKQIQNTEGYTENCGTICVGVSNEHIRKLLRDPNIRMVIPYHKSGLNPIVAHMNKIAEFTDYTNDQRTKGKDGKALSKDFDFSKALHDMGDKASPKAVADQYLKWCVANGYTAKFAEFAAEENYYKLLEDFTLYDKNGNYVPQREVRAVFPKEGSTFGSMKDLIQEGLEEDAVIEGKRDSSLSSIVDEIQRTLPRTEAEISEEQVAQADRDLEAVESSDTDIKYSIREEAPPKKVGVAYKVFLAKDGELYPPMVANPNGEGTPVGVWLNADIGKAAAPSKTGRPQVQGGGKGTNSGKISLAFRPGWHLGDIPLAKQFAKLNPATGKKELFPANFVWAECEYAMDVDYQEEAMSYGYTENGKFRHSYAGLPKLPADGYYRYRTNPNPDTVPWVITGAMRVKRILTDAETDEICRANGVEPMARQGGPINLADFGLAAGDTTENKYSLRDVKVPTRTELEKKDPINVVDISVAQTTGRFADRRKEILKRAKDIISKPYYNKDTKTLIFLTSSSYTHAFNNLGELQLNAAEHLPELVENAVLTHAEPATHGSEYTDRVYTFFAAAKAERVMPVKLKVKEYNYVGQLLPKNIRDYFENNPREYAAAYDTVVLELEEIEKSPSGSARDNIKNDVDPGPEELLTIKVAELINLVKGDAEKYIPKFSDRDTDSVSNRSLLANAFEGVTQNDIERNKIQEYKGKIDLINAEEKKLQDLNKQIKDLSFASGTRDKDKIRKLQDEARKTANRISIYDKQLLRLETSKPLQDVLDREKKKAYKRAERKGREAQEAYRENATKTQKRHKVQFIVKELNDLLLNESKKRHVPDSLKKAVADALALVNMDTVGAEERAAKYADLIAKEQAKAEPDQEKIDSYTMSMENILRQGEKMGQRLKELRDAYEEIQDSDDPDIAGAYDPVIAGSLKELAQSIGNTSLRNMSIEQLSDVYDMYRMVLTRVRDANKSFLNARKESISNLAARVVGEVRRTGGEHTYRAAVLDPVRKFLWNNLKPVYAMEHIGSATLTEVFNAVRSGEDVWAKDVTEARAYYLDKAKKYGYDGWDFKKKYRFESDSGIGFELTLEQILSLYAYAKREQAHDHLRLGGFVFDSNIETYKDKDGKTGNSILKYRVNTADAHQITAEILADIIGKLSAEQKGFVDEMQAYLSTTMGAKGNEVTMAMYGVKLFKEKFYFPLKSAKQFMFEQNEVSGEVRIKNSGFTNKTVAKANNPVILSNFMDVWANHVNDMSMYHAFVLPLEDFNRVFNYNSPKKEGQHPVSVKGTIQSAYSPAAVSYVKNMITDLNGGARTDSTTGPINKLMGMFKKGAVFASASVVIQQPSAIARAAALVDLKYFIGPKINHKRHKALWEEVKKYAPVAIIKEMGYFDTNMGKSTQDFIQGKEYSGVSEKMKALVTDSNYRDEVLSKAPALADEMAWCSIWEAVKRETKAKNRGMDTMSDAFLKKAGERFTEVITKTQVYDSVLSRSANMRSKDTGMKMATAFMAEPTTSINMIADALLQGKRGNRKYARAAIGSVIASQILNSILVSFVYAGRDDDEEETYAEKYISSLTGEILDGMNPATYIPFIKDIVSIVQGYDVERSDMAVISDLWKAYQNLSNDDVSAYRKVEGFVGSICQIFGLPLKNIMKDVRAVFQTYNTIVNGEKTTVRGTAYAVKEAITGKSTSNPVQLYNARLHGDEEHAARVESRYDDEKSADAAVRQAIKDRYLDGELTLAQATMQLTQYAGMKADEAYWLMDGWKHKKETGSDDDYSKYNDFYDAVQTGKNLKAVIKEYTDNGVKNSTLSGQITEHFKPEYVKMSASERAGLKGYLINAYELCGISREAAAEKLRNWDFEAKNGFEYEDRREKYLNGEITASQLRNALITFGGKTEEEADLQIQVYDWEAQGYEGATAAAVREYNEYCAASDVPKDVYMYIRRFSNDTDNEVDEVTGKTIYYSAMKKVMAEIHAQTGLTSDQKDAVARSLGWSEKNIKKYKLW